MTPAKRFLLGTASASLLALAACSGSGASASVVSVVQDLDLDPDGLRTVVEFDGSVGSIGPAHFESSGGQTPTAADVEGGSRVVVTWDERVTPSDQVRVAGVSGVDPDFVDVQTTDDQPPTFVVVSAEQTPGLGGDTLRVAFDGARVVPEDAILPENWSLRVQAVELDLTGSTFTFDEDTQVLDVTLGLLANLHADFTLAATGVRSVADVQVGGSNVSGSATGDSQAPTLLSAEQNLGEDEFGRVVDFTFDEAMDPVFSTRITNFAPGFPVFATSVKLPEEEVLRVSFSAPIVPGVDTVELVDVVDAHGNEAASGEVAIAAGPAVANAFDGDPEFRTVPNKGGDLVEVVFEQAISPADAADDAHWYLEVDSVAVDLSGETLQYDLFTRTLTIRLGDDYTTGDGFELGAAGGDPPLDVDGAAFTATFAGTIGGDDDGPEVVSVTQNRTVDPLGETVDVLFGEDVDETSGEDEANYAIAGLSVDSATLLGTGRTVRLELDAPVVPGDDTLDVSGVVDLAGNTMAPLVAASVASNDAEEPRASGALAVAPQGPDDDTLSVDFDDRMIEVEVEDPDNWIVESPVGTPLDTSGASIAYDADATRAALTFDGGDGVGFHTLDDFLVRLENMRDIGGNEIVPEDLEGDVDAEDVLPSVESIWVETADTGVVHVRFDEAIDHEDDIYDALLNPAGKTRYEVYTSGGVLKGEPDTATLSADGRGAVLDFAFGVVAGSDTLNVHAVTDLAHNQMFPVLDAAVDVEDANEPALAAGASTLVAVAGEANDTVTAVFDRAVSTHGLTDPDNWSLDGPTPIDLGAATFTVLSPTSVRIDLDGGAGNLAYNESYTLSVDGLLSAQGVAMSGSSDEAILVGGDAAAPAFTRVRIDAQDPASLVVELDEALNADDAADETKLDILGVNPTSAVRLGPRTLRATFAAEPDPGDTLDFTNVRDLAGNAGSISIAVTAAATDGPLPTDVSATIAPGVGGDAVEVEFDEPVTSSGLTLSNYTVTNGSVLDLTGSALSFDSTVTKVVIHLPDGVELDADAGLTVGVEDVENHDGFAMGSPANVGGAISGDDDAPTAVAAFVNQRIDQDERVIDVMFSEALEDFTVLEPDFWSASGGQTAMEVTRVRDGVYRVRLGTGLDEGETLSVDGVSDLAGNVAAPLVFEPVF